MKQLVTNLIEEIVEIIYEYDEDIDFYKKSQENSVRKLSINFIQVIKESGFTPPFFV